MTIQSVKSSIGGSVADMRKKFDAIQKEFRKDMQEKLQVELRELFEAHPNVKAVSWRQYTPYFNDGDECIFSAYYSEPTITLIKGEVAKPEDEDEWEDEDYTSVPKFKGSKVVETTYPHKKMVDERDWRTGAVTQRETIDYNRPVDVIRDPTEKELFAIDFVKLMEAVGEDLLKDVYGDHVRVTLTKNEASIEEYNHD